MIVLMIVLCVGLIISLVINWPTIDWVRRIALGINAVAAAGIGIILFLSPRVIGEEEKGEEEERSQSHG
jgi:hypothetical protein